MKTCLHNSRSIDERGPSFRLLLQIISLWAAQLREKWHFSHVSMDTVWILSSTQDRDSVSSIILEKSVNSHKYQTNAVLNTWGYFCRQMPCFYPDGKNFINGICQFHQEGVAGREWNVANCSKNDILPKEITKIISSKHPMPISIAIIF